ncbi:hypothetical protein FEZ41_05395 [Lentilactobacillus parafarraginis]|uniref:DUF5776 domain-containing protein n=3 Tax=Lentilactobacillus parafarraginis TaxID=390842 RepID=A0A0R1YQL4_9LACO|nr:DUF5776 domain-containing protein [Lentilactobacillus parafarraginis]KRM44712.1 hypothetical protein FD47_GL000167 [Lentilactobacillus parafarraginis DSM 18390 = JCM 14109]TLQ19872.1 hypothetical protein FEZ41_05395 [Lentilactobacillus parafarraginis]
MNKAVAIFGLGVGLLSFSVWGDNGHSQDFELGVVSAQADAANSGTTIAINKDNFSTYFQESGDASYDQQNGVVNLIPDKSPNGVPVAGMTYLSGNMDMNKSFHLAGEIEIQPGFSGSTYSDGIVFAFRPGDPTQVGNPGAGIGVGGIKGAFGVVIDTYYNGVGEIGRSQSDPIVSPYISFFKNLSSPGLSSVSSNIIHSSYAKAMIDDRESHPQGLRYGDFKKGNLLPFTISYDGATKQMSYSLTTVDGRHYQGTHDFSQEVSGNTGMNLAISSGGEASQARVNLLVNSIQFSAMGVVNVDYIDEQTGTKLPESSTLKGGLNEMAYIKSASVIDTLRKQGYRLDQVAAPKSYDYDNATLPFGGTEDLSKLPYKDVLQEVKFYFKKDIADKIAVKINYVDADTHQSIAPSQQVSGTFGTSIPNLNQAITGYTADPANPTHLKFGALDESGKTLTEVTLKYHQNHSTSSGTPKMPGSPAAFQPIAPSQPTAIPSPDPTSDSRASSSSQPDESRPSLIAKRGAAVYTVKPIYLYRHADFNKSERKAFYAKKPRVNRPMFVVTDYARSKDGQLRYQVRDVNHKSRTAGKTGYITADSRFTLPVYYQGAHPIVTVINPEGVNRYAKKNLRHRTGHYRQGQVIPVQGITRHNLTTRFILADGQYMTANRKLVISGKHPFSKAVRVKKALNLYADPEFTHVQKQIGSGQTLAVNKTGYSQAATMQARGHKRYAVKGGYITANPDDVQIEKMTRS